MKWIKIEIKQDEANWWIAPSRWEKNKKTNKMLKIRQAKAVIY